MSGKDVVMIILENTYAEITSRWYIYSVVKKEKTVWVCRPPVSRSRKLDLVYFSFHFLFSFQFIFPFSIFRTTRVRVDRSRCYISHLMVWSQDKSQDMREFSRRFKNK